VYGTGVSGEGNPCFGSGLVHQERVGARQLSDFSLIGSVFWVSFSLLTLWRHAGKWYVFVCVGVCVRVCVCLDRCISARIKPI